LLNDAGVCAAGERFAGSAFMSARASEWVKI
jgi:hypothetical protein